MSLIPYGDYCLRYRVPRPRPTRFTFPISISRSSALRTVGRRTPVATAISLGLASATLEKYSKTSFCFGESVSSREPSSTSTRDLTACSFTTERKKLSHGRSSLVLPLACPPSGMSSGKNAKRDNTGPCAVRLSARAKRTQRTNIPLEARGDS